MRYTVITLALLAAATGALSTDIPVERYRLGNGLQVVLSEDHSAPLVSVNVWYHVGSKNEKPGRTGFAHLFEHMLFSGSEHVANNDHFRYVQSVGGVLNGSTNFDRTNYFETMPSNYLARALWLEADRMGFFLPALDQKKLDIQKEVVKEERRQRYDNVPYGTWAERTYRLAFEPTYPYHWPTIGSMEDLTAAQIDDVRAFFRTYYSPSNAVLTIVGDFDSAEAKALVARYFEAIPAGPPIERFNGAPAPIGEGKREVVPSPVQLPRVYRLYLVPPVGQPEWFAADLATNILSGDKSSRLEKALVLEKQLAQDVTAFTFPTSSTGLFFVSATARPGVDIGLLERELDAELARLGRGVSNEELERAQNVNETGWASRLQQFSTRADLISMFTTFFDDPGLINRWPSRYRALTATDVERFAQAYLRPSNGVTVQFVPEKKGDAR